MSCCRLHNESRCGRLQSFVCVECGARFLTEDSLTLHGLRHKGRMRRRILKERFMEAQEEMQSVSKSSNSDGNSKPAIDEHLAESGAACPLAPHEILIDERPLEE